jgi:hypothetical protein
MVNKESDPALEPALRDVDSIQNLDTARLALRWALERMRSLEKRAAEVETAATRAESARLKAVSDLEGARDLLTRRANEGLERERYYAKIEEYLNLKLEGGFDAAAMAAREVRIDAREAELQRREIDTANQIAAAKQRVDEETRRTLAENAAAAELRVKKARDEYERRGAARDAELTERLLAQHEKEAQLSSLERSLDERRKRFEEFFAAQRAALEREAAAITEAASDQAGFLERRVEQALTAKTSVIEHAWQADKAILMEELATWRAKAREHLPELLEARRRADEFESVQARLIEENRLLSQTKATLTEELLRWRTEAQNDLPSLLATVRRAVEAEEHVAHLQAELEMAQRRAEESLGQLISDEIGQETRRRELMSLETALTSKLRDAEQDLFRQYDAWLAREGVLRRRDQEWRLEAEARHESVNVLRAEVTAQRDELKRVIADYREKAAAVSPSADGEKE